jgi:uncharacterized integral membrane protein
MWVVRTILIVAVFVILLGFGIYNAGEKVAVTILNTRYINVPLIVVAFWSCVFGLLVSILLFITVYFKQVGEIRRQRRINESLAAEIAALRNRPIEEADDSFLLPDKENNK